MTEINDDNANFPHRSNILHLLGHVWTDNPELRLGQMITLLVKDTDVFYVEDDALIDLWAAKLPNKKGGVAQLGERRLCKSKVVGSMPTTSTKHK